MPLDYNEYPKNWPAIRAEILKRARGRCECRGECGLHRMVYTFRGLRGLIRYGAKVKVIHFHERNPGRVLVEWKGTPVWTFTHQLRLQEIRRCTERQGKPAKYARGKVVLTVAHRCHKPKCARRVHLYAACQRCHLRYDLPLHRRHAAERRERAAGQRRLFPR